MSESALSYVETASLTTKTVHDADSHVMELPTKIVDYFEQSYLDDFAKYANKAITVTKDLDAAVTKHDDPDFRADDEAQLLLRKNHLALGSFRNEDRPQCLDLLGFTSQLVFTTAALGNYGLDDSQPVLAGHAARAHNRMNADFCSVDKRLLATGYIPLSDINAAPAIAKEAIELGCKGLIIPSKCPDTHSPTRTGFDPIWALAQEAGIPILFHVGGETKMPAAYTENGLAKVKDFHGGDENFTGLSFMSIPLAVWQTMAAFVFDGVLSRFPNLMFGAIELGAGWLPSWMQFLDSGFEAFRKGEERLQKLNDLPSDIVKQQFRVTPYSHEPTGWIMQNTSPDMLLFSSDFPHVEGGRNPLKRFEDNMADITDEEKRKFYRDNFISLMGNGLDRSLHDHPGTT